MQTNFRDIDILAVAAISSRHICSQNAIRILEQAYENINFTAIQRAANDRSYSTLQHFAVLALLRIASHHSRRSSRVSSVVTGCALEYLFKGARIRESHSSKILRCVILSTFGI